MSSNTIRNPQSAIPNSLVGVLGAGQLGRMTALAGYPLGVRFRFLDPTPGSPASHMAEQVVASYDDMFALELFSDGLQVVTYEFENVPAKTAARSSRSVPARARGRAIRFERPSIP